MHDKDDMDKLEELHEKGEEKVTFKSVINKKKVNDFEMDMLFFEGSSVEEEEERNDEF